MLFARQQTNVHANVYHHRIDKYLPYPLILKEFVGVCQWMRKQHKKVCLQIADMSFSHVALEIVFWKKNEGTGVCGA